MARPSASLRSQLVDILPALGTEQVGLGLVVVVVGVPLLIVMLALAVFMSLLVTAVSMLAVPLVYDQPGVYVGVVTDSPVGIHPALYIGWNNLLVGIETVVTLPSWRIDTLLRHS